ncbi:MAG: hypothetical protein KDC53_09225, partial [Saprospiraceae bacterium]|nr:hypothetical protein [Saprospiraceae bacterium]
MGFSDLGRTINNNNERLRKNIREKYFRSPAASDKDDSGNQHYIYIDPLTTKTSNRSMWIIPLVMVGLIFMGGFFVVHWLETIVKKSNLAYEHNLETLREQADYNRVVRGYQILTEEGFRFLDKHQYGDAMRSFAQALNLRQNGHSANYGITK